MREEQALIIQCGDVPLVGILHSVAKPFRRGVVIVVGGPQYRVGSHRQFLLLSRSLAAAGIPSLRFDYRGMGDSPGPVCDFEHIEDDIHAAINTFMSEVPELEEVVLWGLCDAASAILIYAHRDSRVSGLALLNPWVRSEAGIAKAYLKHYYVRRLTDYNFWLKVLRGEFRFGEALSSLFSMIGRALGRAGTADVGLKGVGRLPLVQRMKENLHRFQGRVLLILSGDDLTADEFRGTIAKSRDWRRLLGERRVQRFDLSEANHTFASRQWRDRVAERTIEWIKQG